MEQLIFFSLWLHLDSQSFKTVRNFIYLPHPAALLLAAGGDVNKLCYLTSGSFLLFINIYCWPEFIISWPGRECYWSNYYLAMEVLSSQYISSMHQLIQMMCAMFGNRHMLMNNIFDLITQPEFSYCFIGLAFVWNCRSHMLI